jgi:hypothetical protein
MKLSIGFYIAIVILCIVLAISLSTSYRVKPYSPSTLFSSGAAKYEGFNGMKPLYYGTYPDNKAIDQKDSYDIQSVAANKTAQRILSLGGLFGPADTPDNKLDIFSDAKSSLTCSTNSSGMSTSTGFLCLDQNQINLLKTRGGNQTGCPCTIGGSGV